MSRALLRSVLELRTPITRLPPSFLLPIRTAGARCLHQTSQIVDPVQQQLEAGIPLQPQAQKPSSSSPIAEAASNISSSSQPTTQPAKLHPSVRQLLPILAAQPGRYITIHIHGKPYLVTEGDSVRLPFKMPGVTPGDVLRLNRATNLGSRDYTLQGSPYVDERLFECRAVVIGTEAEPMRTLVKKKRRCRRKKTVHSKHRFTILRISELKVCDVNGLD
ncbi:ribosomal protein L21-like protein [Rhypophila decipiens]|uniref:Large ribosomal subunit protein bL21m n=1 Tax=Rhypophila decipiens TaxID=261697 RepID=A0AAN6YLB9_9PEZI|nr:ribosomal protein L21-like protein [Rhypophila decipiens]